MKVLVLLLALLALSCGRQDDGENFTMDCVWVNYSSVQRCEGSDFICYKYRNSPMECYDKEY